jgi:flagellar protein FlaF
LQALAYKAYGQTTRRTADPKAIEFALFEQITQALELVQADGGADLGLWADTLHRNMQLWTVIATDLLNPDNALAAETKSGLFSLSEFVRRTSHQVLSGGDGLADLIEINRTIMAGLAGTNSQGVGEGL